MADLAGKAVIVTGGGRGLGRAMVFGLAEAGANVCAAAHIEDDLKSVDEEARDLRLPGQIIGQLADLRDARACQAVIDQTRDAFGPIYGLVNNAGLTFTYIAPGRYRRGYSKKFYELTDEIVQNVIDTNFVAADRMARLIAPYLIAQGAGCIVNVTTMLKTMTKSTSSPYGPSKAALENASEIWVKDLEGTGVSVNILNPGGAANTPGFTTPEDRELSSKAVGGLVEAYKMKAPICWLMSEEASDITGMRYDAGPWDETKDPGMEAKRIGSPLGLTLKPRD